MLKAWDYSKPKKLPGNIFFDILIDMVEDASAVRPCYSCSRAAQRAQQACLIAAQSPLSERFMKSQS